MKQPYIQELDESNGTYVLRELTEQEIDGTVPTFEPELTPEEETPTE